MIEDQSAKNVPNPSLKDLLRQAESLQKEIDFKKTLDTDSDLPDLETVQESQDIAPPKKRAKGAPKGTTKRGISQVIKIQLRVKISKFYFKFFLC